MSFQAFCSLLRVFPALYSVVGLTLAVVLVNGWTDAPNAIATTVASGSLPFRSAVFLAAVCNFLGVWFTSLTLPVVADTVYSIADFQGNSFAALTALSAAMLAIVLWAVLAWHFGIPTSESHALMAGVTGAAVALQGSAGAIRWNSWIKVLFGLVFSLLAGYLLGGLLTRPLPRRLNYRGFQILGMAVMSFLHGAQDGQKFVGVFLLGINLSKGEGGGSFPPPPLWLVFIISAVMASGTLIGGRRIIDKICRDMTSLPSRESFAADLGGGITLAIATLLGLPVSTTHAKTASILGAGMASGQTVGKAAVGQIGLTWLLTFPACLFLGWLTATLVLG